MIKTDGDMNLDEELKIELQKLYASNKPLPPDIESLLIVNLWDLYARAEKGETSSE